MRQRIGGNGRRGGQAGRIRRGIAFALMLGWGLAAFDAAARTRAVDPGEMPTLGADEGLLVVAVDSNVDLDSVSVKKDGKLFSSGMLSNLKAGRNSRLYVVPAGTYEWEQVRLFGSIRYELKSDPEYRFEVPPGKITYSGDLVFRPLGWLRADVQVTNRGLKAIDWLEAEHPDLAKRYPFEYSGHYPDPFPAFHRQVRSAAGSSAAELSRTVAPPAPGPLPLAIDELWREDRIDSVYLNGAGDLLAERVREKDRWEVHLIDLKAGTSLRLVQAPEPIASIRWAGDRVLLVGTGNDKLRQSMTIIRVRDAAGGQRAFDVLKMHARGHVLDPVPESADRILFAGYGTRGGMVVHWVDISNQRALDQTGGALRSRLNTGVDGEVRWFADGSGQLRAALAQKDGDYLLMHGSGGDYKAVLNLGSERSFEPVVLSYDGNVIYGLSDEGRSQRDLVVFDPAQGRVTQTLFSKPGIDVVEPLLDARRTPIGVTYYEGGQLVSEYFDARDQKLAGILRNTFPERTVAVVARSRDGRQLVLWVDGSDQPPKLYHLDVDRRQASLLEASRPWLEGKRFVASRRLSVKAPDGLPIEAYLTLPPGQERRPLVVMPHGGPVGVSDHQHFNPEVQFLASLGYAVLQVNFRGSDGYGKAFREAGYGKQGTLIEDDVDSAIREVLASQPVDPQRMCVVGASYGGYSALVSTMRWPDRFRCAVSIAGVSDRVLLFTASDSGHWARGREALVRVFGDPKTQLDQMLAVSPLYHYRELKTPIMLVHGEEDMRVDYEHARRMVRMLNLDGRAPVMLTFADEGHGIDEMDHIATAWSGIAGFLRQHLAVGSGSAAGAAARQP
jgi:dipeptidyl aminopeptidase/acylaminoacyl peptidase